MDDFFKLTLVLLFLLIIIVLGFLIFLAFIILRDRQLLRTTPPKSEEKDPPKKVEPLYGCCANHPDRDATGVCGICEQTFCEKCLKEHEKLHFCPEHYKLFQDNHWESIAEVQTTPDRPEKGIFLYHFKHEIWKNNVPSYIVTHYKINVENDFIESHVSLFVRQEDTFELSKKLEQSKKSGPEKGPLRS